MRLVAAAIGASIALTGCSLFTARPPDRDRADGSIPVCNTGKGSVGLDGAVAVLAGIAAIAGFAADEPGVGVGFGLVSAAYGGSAVHGSRSARRCREAMAAYELEEEQRDMFVGAPRRAVPAPTLEEPYPEPEPEPEPEAEPEPEPEPERDPETDWPDFWKVIR